MRLAPRPGSSGFEAAPIKAKITQITMNAPIPTHRHTQGLSSPLVFASEGFRD
jgi:hypothetical protein